jgi:hypothetical protein
MNQQQKVERWAERELRRNIDHLIIDEGNSLIVFGLYVIESADQGWRVSDHNQVIHQFQNKKTAISWCVADKYKKYQLASNILNLDRKKQLLAADIHCRKVLGERSRTESFRETVEAKVQPKILQLNGISSELEKCINQTKYLQIRGFSNETERTRGSQAQ